MMVLLWVLAVIALVAALLWIRWLVITHVVRIRYKSGQTVRVRCRSMTVSRSVLQGGITEIKWESMRPRPMHLGVDDVESIWINQNSGRVAR